MAYRGSSSKVLEMCKYMLAFTCGYILKSMVDIPPSNYCQSCPECPTVAPRINGSLVLHEQFKPRTMYEVLRYDFFTSKHLYNNVDDDPRIGLLSHQKQDLSDILSQAETSYNIGYPNRWKIEKFIHGYRRIDPLRGEEYELDVMLSATDQPTKRHRLIYVKPFTSAQLISAVDFEQPKTIHLILPIGNLTERFDAFMNNFAEVCKKSKSHIYLLIVVFLQRKENDDIEMEKVKGKIRALRNYEYAHVQVMQTYKPFSRALGIDLGVKQLPTHALMFFCDVDVVFTEEFLQRCRYNAVPTKRVYYPMVFAQYKPDIIKQYSPAERSKDLFDINKYTGHWVHYGYGMTCLYHTDYQLVGGYNTSIVGWGGEDVDLYQRHVKSNLQVMRAAEPGLIHQYHKKTCSDELSGPQLTMCRASMAEGIGSRQQLAKYIHAQLKENQV